MGSDGPPPSSGTRCGRSGDSGEPGSGHSPNAKRRAYAYSCGYSSLDCSFIITSGSMSSDALNFSTLPEYSWDSSVCITYATLDLP